MKTLLKLEEAALTLGALYFLSFHLSGLPVWLWVLLFFAPDIGMLGYLFNNRIGGFTYNFLHHRAIAIMVAAVGFGFHQESLIGAGILLFAHASFDRIWGYGLKYSDSFSHTHLGNIGKEKV